ATAAYTNTSVMKVPIVALAKMMNLVEGGARAWSYVGEVALKCAQIEMSIEINNADFRLLLWMVRFKIFR
ncbi:hypothetical protein OFC57_36995, partial [Escherichia coli]|nr:hypothetical protein [Escherichia coli]